MWQDYRDKPLSVTSGVVHLWRTRLICTDDQLVSYQRLLSADEMVRGNRFVKESDQIKFFVGKAILRQVLSLYLKIPPAQIVFMLGKNEKPYLSHRKLQFNLSHSGACQLIAVTAEDEIGVDVEHARIKQDCLALAERFFAKSEYEAIKKLPAENQMAAFYRCWTRKEAFIKATGLGLSFGLSEFEVGVTEISSQHSALLSIKNDTCIAKKWILQSVAIDDFSENYFAAFAVQKAVTSVVCWNYSIDL